MIIVSALRAGTVFQDQGQLLQVLSYEHIKMGRGSATIRVKVKNLRTGGVVEKSFTNGAKVDNVDVFKRDLQFLYKDSDNAYFMNPTTFEQVSIPMKVVGEDHYYLKEGENANISFLGDEALSINLTPKMEFEVVDTAPGVKGNSATNVFKDAVLENGLNTKVPLFINIGDRIRVDTRTGAYSERA